MRKPNLFIVGAPKAGTTFLYERLIDHTDFFFPKLKELNYFSHRDLQDSYYIDYRCENESAFLKHYKGVNNELYVVDPSVSYFSSLVAIDEISKFNKDAKIVIAIRNPLKRAFSHYQMDIRMGYASDSFLNYISKPGTPHYKQYIENSLYYKYIRLYQEKFGSENVHVVILESFEEDLKKLFKNLNLDSSYIDQIEFSKKVNENKSPKNFIGKAIQKNRNVVSKLKLLLPKGLIATFKPLLYGDAKTMEMTENEKNELLNLLSADMEQLEQLLQVDLKGRWN